jgi:hypothetical protein
VNRQAAAIDVRELLRHIRDRIDEQVLDTISADGRSESRHPVIPPAQAGERSRGAPGQPS